MIRAYRPSDRKSVVTVWRAASDIVHDFLPNQFLDQEAENLRNLYLVHAETWVHEEGKEVTGFIALINDEIGGLFVSPHSQRKGVGLEFVRMAAALRGSLGVEVFAKNRIGRGFYTKAGFVASSQRIHDETGEVLIRMERLPT